MGPSEAEVKCCPRCKRLVEARDYMHRSTIAITGAVLPKIYCPCGYRGLPIAMSRGDYERWLKAE